jgi:hypothetical protein
MSLEVSKSQDPSELVNEKACKYLKTAREVVTNAVKSLSSASAAASLRRGVIILLKLLVLV